MSKVSLPPNIPWGLMLIIGGFAFAVTGCVSLFGLKVGLIITGVILLLAGFIRISGED